MNNLIKYAGLIPADDAQAALSLSSIVLASPDRGVPLEVRVTAPLSGNDLPVILLSHGHGPSFYIPSKDGYGPLANFYAEHGFVVIQPTHLNSKVAGLPADAPGGPLFWRSRVEDMVAIIDQLDTIEATFPGLAGRLDRTKIGIVGHSMGGQTAAMLLGARLTDPRDSEAQDVNVRDERIKAGVLLTIPGNGGESLSEDASPHLTVRGPSWHADPYYHSPGSEALLTMIDAEHGLGGISGYDAKETQDEDPERLAVVQRMTCAYLRSALDGNDQTWRQAVEVLGQHPSLQANLTVR